MEKCEKLPSKWVEKCEICYICSANNFSISGDVGILHSLKPAFAEVGFFFLAISYDHARSVWFFFCISYTISYSIWESWKISARSSR